MDVLKFKSNGSAVDTWRIYSLDSVKKITHTVAKNGTESLTIIFVGGTETLKDSDDIAKIFKKLKTVEANKNEIDKAEKKTSNAKNEIQQRREAAAKADQVKKDRAAKIRAEIKKRNTLKKAPAKKVAKKTTKKATKKASKSKAKKKTKK